MLEIFLTFLFLNNKIHKIKIVNTTNKKSLTFVKKYELIQLFIQLKFDKYSQGFVL